MQIDVSCVILKKWRYLVCCILFIVSCRAGSVRRSHSVRHGWRSSLPSWKLWRSNIDISSTMALQCRQDVPQAGQTTRQILFHVVCRIGPGFARRFPVLSGVWWPNRSHYSTGHEGRIHRLVQIIYAVHNNLLKFLFKYHSTDILRVNILYIVIDRSWRHTEKAVK